MKFQRVYYFGAGSCHNLDSSVDGTKHIRLPLMRCLNSFGTKVTWLGFSRENNVRNHYLDLIGLSSGDFVDDVRNLVKDISESLFDRQTVSLKSSAEQIIRTNPGILFVELRPNLAKPGYEFADEFKIQSDLIDLFISLGLPVLLWDMDNDSWSADIKPSQRENTVLLRAYCEKNKNFPRQHEFLFAWYVPEFERRLLELSQKKIFDVTYCGNVYGRRDDFLLHMRPFHEQQKRVCVQGNWLRKKYDDRDFSLDNFPNFMFFGQTPHWSTLPSIALGKSVIHFSNPDQQRLGLPTARIFETLMGKSVIFCSEKIRHVDRLVPDELIVSGPEDLIERWNKIDMTNQWENTFKRFESKLRVRENSYFARAHDLLRIVIDEFGVNERWIVE